MRLTLALTLILLTQCPALAFPERPLTMVVP